MKIGILGAGAMGGLYGGSLAKIGHNVIFIDVVQAQIDAINKNGLKLIRNGETTVIRAQALRAGEVEQELDLLMLFTKTISSAKALESVRNLLTDTIQVLSLQNGLGNQEIIEQFVSREQVIIGMTGYPADLSEPGVVISSGDSYTAIVDATGGVSEKTRAIANQITLAGLNCLASEQAFTYIWEKVAFNAAVNALTAVTRLPVGVMADNGGRQLAFDVAAEAVAVAQALGVAADRQKVLDMLEHAFVDHYHHKPSMLQDILAQRPTEVGSINGAIASKAAEAGLEAPLNRTLFRLITIIQNACAS